MLGPLLSVGLCRVELAVDPDAHRELSEDRTLLATLDDSLLLYMYTSTTPALTFDLEVATTVEGQVTLIQITDLAYSLSNHAIDLHVSPIVSVLSELLFVEEVGMRIGGVNLTLMGSQGAIDLIPTSTLVQILLSVTTTDVRRVFEVLGTKEVRIAFFRLKNEIYKKSLK